MPYYVPPRSDFDRSRFLQRTAASAAADHAAGNFYISSETLTAVTALAAQFDTAVRAISGTKRARSQEALERSEALAELSAYVRDLWAVLRRRVRRLKQPANVLLYYGLPIDGETPHPTAQDAWLPIAADVVSGDAEAVAAGFPPMSNPSAAELQAVLDMALTEAGEADAADRIFDQAQAAVAGLRGEIDQMIDDVMSELRFTLRREDKPSQRRIMRTYGAKYAYLEGEPIDPDDQPEGDPPPE